MDEENSNQTVPLVKPKERKVRKSRKEIAEELRLEREEQHQKDVAVLKEQYHDRLMSLVWEFMNHTHANFSVRLIKKADVKFVYEFENYVYGSTYQLPSQFDDWNENSIQLWEIQHRFEALESLINDHKAEQERIKKKAEMRAKVLSEIQSKYSIEELEAVGIPSIIR